MNEIGPGNNPYANAFKNFTNAMSIEGNSNQETSSKNQETYFKASYTETSINLSISDEGFNLSISIRSFEFSSYNTNNQSILDKILNGNQEALDFLSGKDAFSSNLKEMGYEGKPISDLGADEAQELLAEGGFFSIEKTSDRVSSFVFLISGNNIDALQESRKGIVQGFEEAEKMWGGELPEISYKTQERTLALIDAKISELLGTNVEENIKEEETN